jgi:chromosome segregation ATPase
LKASAQEYMSIRQREQEKDILLSEIRRELQAATEQNIHQQTRLKETDEMCTKLKQEVHQLDNNFKATQHELINVTTQLTTITSAANEYKSQMEEYAAISQRYKTQLLEQRERIRVLESSATKQGQQESDYEKMMNEFELVMNENRTLKSQLYDSMQIEQQLRNKLEGSGKEVPESIVDANRLRQAEQEVLQLKAEVQAKAAENTELLAMVDSLIRQVEEKEQTF